MNKSKDVFYFPPALVVSIVPTTTSLSPVSELNIIDADDTMRLESSSKKMLGTDENVVYLARERNES